MKPASNILLAITQRVVPVPSRSERRDALDQSWAPFLESCGFEAIAVPNRHPDPAAFLQRFGVSGIILSGGGNISSSLGTLSGRPPQIVATDADLAPERDVTETALLRASIEHGLPVLGVCRGMQVLNLFHGGRLAPVAGHAGSRHGLSVAKATGRAQAFAFDREVNSFHDCGIPPNDLAPGFQALATADGYPEAFLHQSLPHLGIMWHPERNQPFSRSDIATFQSFFPAPSR
jgi:N5-(cytidine 5'-diphosphoramidyl)-L-glutamine hydrolase